VPQGLIQQRDRANQNAYRAGLKNQALQMQQRDKSAYDSAKLQKEWLLGIGQIAAKTGRPVTEILQELQAPNNGFSAGEQGGI
jgi:hypothetical protein